MSQGLSASSSLLCLLPERGCLGLLGIHSGWDQTEPVSGKLFPGLATLEDYWVDDGGRTPSFQKRGGSSLFTMPYFTGPNSRRVIPSSLITARTVPGARSLLPQSGIEATDRSPDCARFDGCPYPLAVPCSPTCAAVARACDSVSGLDQCFHCLRAIGQKWP
jgi:hypothetical protein